MANDREHLVDWLADEILPHENDLRRWLLSVLKDREDVEDVIQEAYCRIAKLRGVEHIQTPRAYFFRTAKSVVLDQMRRARVVRFETVAEFDHFDFDEDVPSPERITAARQELNRVLSLVAGLPERCRRIFTLRKIQGESQKSIAALMGLSEATVENEVGKALKLIARALAEETSVVGERRVEGGRR